MDKPPRPGKGPLAKENFVKNVASGSTHKGNPKSAKKTSVSITTTPPTMATENAKARSGGVLDTLENMRNSEPGSRPELDFGRFGGVTVPGQADNYPPLSQARRETDVEASDDIDDDQLPVLEDLLDTNRSTASAVAPRKGTRVAFPGTISLGKRPLAAVSRVSDSPISKRFKPGLDSLCDQPPSKPENSSPQPSSPASPVYLRRTSSPRVFLQDEVFLASSMPLSTPPEMPSFCTLFAESSTPAAVDFRAAVEILTGEDSASIVGGMQAELEDFMTWFDENVDIVDE
jgi:hypothetical protein